jgi:flagellum-specific ATP synthase
VSRLMPDVVDKDALGKVSYLKGVMSTYKEAYDLISIGAYKNGSSPKIDEAIALNSAINDLLKQQVDDRFSYEETMELVSQIYDRRSV